MTAKDSAAELLVARIDDAIGKAEKGTVASLPFLTPRDASRAKRELQMRGMLGQAYFFGGYPDAERVCLFLLPDYLLAYPEEQEGSEDDTRQLSELFGDEIKESVSALRITGSGFCKLTHRDYLGAILGLGLERDAIGDVAVQNDHEAVVFCSSRLIPFFKENLLKVARDSVSCTEYTVDEHFTDGRSYAPISTTVASARLDCIVAALTNLSREAAQSTIRACSVEVNFEETDRVDLLLAPPATISIRGHGRFILRAFEGETRKGRMRLRADKLV